MGNLSSGLIVIIATVVLVGLIFLLTSLQSKKREAELRNLASLNGWVYESVHEANNAGWRLQKGEWKIVSLNQTTKGSSTTTVTSQTSWFSSAARMKDGIVMIGPHMPEIAFGRFDNVIVQAALQMMIGDRAAEAVGLQRVELGSLELMARYMVWTNREAVAKALLDDALENALLAWPGNLPTFIRFSSDGLEIKIQNKRLTKPTEIEALVKLGSNLIDSAYQAVKE